MRCWISLLLICGLLATATLANENTDDSVVVTNEEDEVSICLVLKSFLRSFFFLN